MHNHLFEAMYECLQCFEQDRETVILANSSTKVVKISKPILKVQSFAS